MITGWIDIVLFVLLALLAGVLGYNGFSYHSKEDNAETQQNRFHACGGRHEWRQGPKGLVCANCGNPPQIIT